jgi:hypothetical protein
MAGGSGGFVTGPVDLNAYYKRMGIQVPQVPPVGSAPAYAQPAEVPAAPTFAPSQVPAPAAVATSSAAGTSRDPRIESLITALSTQSPSAPNSRVTDLAGQIERLNNEPINVGDVSTSDEARAYRIERERQAERQRMTAADRLGASGVTGSGAFDSEVNAIREGVGSDTASFVGQLAGKRRGDLLAERGAKTSNLKDLINVLMAQDNATAQNTNASRSSQQQLLSQLMGDEQATRGENRADRDSAQSSAAQNAELAMEYEKFRREMLQQQLVNPLLATPAAASSAPRTYISSGYGGGNNFY